MDDTQGDDHQALRPWFLTLVGVILLFAPLIGIVAVHPRGTPENRPPTEFPGWAAGWSWPGQFAAAVADRLSIRQAAISADGWIDENVFADDRAFGGSVLPAVIRGGDDTLFYAQDFRNACSGPVQSESIAAYKRFIGALNDAELPSVTLVAPDKSSVLTALVPAGLALRACRDAYSNVLWAELNAAALPGWDDLRARLRRLSDIQHEAVYFRFDSHWTPLAAMEVSKVIVDSIQPGLFASADVLTSPGVSRRGDLAALVRLPGGERVPDRRLNRAGIVVISSPSEEDLLDSSTIDHFVHRSIGVPIVEGKTLFLIDSFGEITSRLFLQYFEDVTLANLRFVSPQDIANLIGASDRVVVMSVERHFPRRSLTLFGDPALLEAISQLKDR